LVVLAGIIAGLGQALQLIPIDIVRIIIGALLLTFGLQWFRQGVVRTAADGFTGGAEEEEEPGAGPSGGVIDWTAFVLAFKGVLLEGLEVAFIVVAFGAGGGGSGGLGGSTGGGNSYTVAYIGAAAAFVVIGALGLVAKSQLQKVPGRTLKFGVGGLLSTFGTFWALEGLGVHWPGGDLSLAWLYALYLSSTFLLMLAVRAGLLGPPPASAMDNTGPAGPSGLAPASELSIREFQREHGLAADGVVGPRTQAAVRAIRAVRDADLDAVTVGVDPADPEAIAGLQQRLDLPASGQLDGMSRGALRLLQHPGFVDPLDEAAVRRFQRDHGLDPSGQVDEPTRIALGAVLGDRPEADASEDPGPDQRRRDPVACFRELDPADQRSVCRFQKSLDIPESGDLDAETRGAMRAMRAWLVVDPTDAEAVKKVQRRHELVPDAIIGEQTRRAIAEERQRAARERGSGQASSEPDPYEAGSVCEFQRRHGLAETGVIGPETRAAIRWEREHHLSVDAASGESIRAFQRAHDLAVDGVLGEQTRAALQAAREELERGDRKAREERYGDEDGQRDGRIIDPADERQVRRFQREHQLVEDGRIGPRTRTAMRSVRHERARPDPNSDDRAGATKGEDR
ncbi:MAG TPA: peptidoglycan-binding protein, partial [Solirubrobacteraceae bacterium]|nr:peptidoglycan-binding protein [Solirubrobacteraceae bacterium]